MNVVALLTNGTVPFGAAPIQQPPSQAGGAGQTGTRTASPGPVAIAPPPTVGTGADTVTLNLSEDAYKGNAQFVFTVDGKPTGPVQTVTASHKGGQSETFTLKGDWPAGAHQFGVSFVNDLWDGTPATDRNLYIDSASYNGSRVANPLVLLKNSTAVFGAAPVSEPPGNTIPGVSAPGYPGQGGPDVPPTIGTGPNSVTLNLSEDADAGDALFVFLVDGQQVGPTQSVTALHGKDPSEAFTFRGDWGSGPHQFGVAFVNGSPDGSPGANRHLYLNSAGFNSNLVANATEVANGTPVTFGEAAVAGPPGQPIGLSAPAPHQGSTKAASGGTPPSPAHLAKSTIASINAQILAFGSGTQRMSFASPQNLTITGGPGADTVTATSGTNTFVAGAGSMDITGGSGASDFILHAGSGKLTIEDFLPSKGDVLTVGKALQPNFKQASDGHGGTLLTFGAGQGSIDLIGYSATTQPHITFA